MEEKDIGEVRARIKKFLNSNLKVLEINYTGKSLNASKYYHSVIFANPLFFMFKAFIMGLCYFMPAGEMKNSLYRMLGMKIGKEVFISAGVILDAGFPQLISIGDGVVIGQGATIFAHESTIAKIRIGRVNIGKRSLIGIKSTIRSGVVIGDNSVVVMGAVVVQDVQSNELVGGVPAKTIRKLTEPL